MLDPGNAWSASAIARSETPIARAAAVAAAAFARLWAPRMRGSAGSGSSAENSTRRASPGTGAKPRGSTATSSRPLPCEHAQLRGRVRAEVAVAVEVVGLEVREDGDPGTELVDILELERGELAYDPCGGVGLVDEQRQRPADVAGDLDRVRGRLRIAPSNAVVVVFPFVPVTPIMGFGRARPELDLEMTGTPRARAATTSCAAAGTPGLFTSSPTPSEPSQVPRTTCFEPVDVRGRVGVECHDLDPTPPEHRGRGPTRPGEPDDEHTVGKRRHVAIVGAAPGATSPGARPFCFVPRPRLQNSNSQV